MSARMAPQGIQKLSRFFPLAPIARKHIGWDQFVQDDLDFSPRHAWIFPLDVCPGNIELCMSVAWINDDTMPEIGDRAVGLIDACVAIWDSSGPDYGT